MQTSMAKGILQGSLHDSVKIMQSLLLQDDIPFAHQVAKFPVKKRPKLPPSFAAMKEVTAMRSSSGQPHN